MMQAVRIMGANALTTSTIALGESLVPNSVYTQCVRWKRKPIWLPTAKSKLFRVPKRPTYPVEEFEEFKRLNNHYRTYMSSLRYMRNTCSYIILQTYIIVRSTLGCVIRYLRCHLSEFLSGY